MVELPLGEVRYLHLKADAPSAYPIIFIHGMSYPLEVWMPLQLEAVQSNLESISYDLYGRGKSSFTGDELTTRDLSNQVFDLLERLKISSKVHIVSLSNADWIAISFAQRFPDRTASISLVAPSGIDERTLNRRMKIISGLPHIHSILNSATRKRLRGRMIKHSRNLPRTTSTDIIEIYDLSQKSVLQNPDFTRAFWSQIAGAPNHQQSQDMLDSINEDLPLQIIRFAEEQDSTLRGIELFRKRKRIIEHVFETGGHMSLLENPSEIWSLLLDFWR